MAAAVCSDGGVYGRRVGTDGNGRRFPGLPLRGRQYDGLHTNRDAHVFMEKSEYARRGRNPWARREEAWPRRPSHPSVKPELSRLCASFLQLLNKGCQTEQKQSARGSQSA